jgi:TolB-like protein/Tfp pilus assembly protein PilF
MPAMSFPRISLAVALLVAAPAFAAPQDAKEKNKKAPVVAVFPFKVLNKEDKLAHLGEGAADAIINKIVNDKSLRIVEESQLDKAVNSIARNQSGLFEEDSDLAVGQMVDARFIVIGSVQVVAEQVAVNARLLEVETRQLLASARSTRPYSDTLGAYEEVGGAIMSKMSFHLAQRVAAGEGADAIAVKQLIEEAKAYDPLFPTGMDSTGRTVEKNMSKAVASYNKAVLRDPKSSQAQLALGHAESRYAANELAGDAMRSRQTLESARDHLTRATELDTNNAYAFLELGRAQGRLGNHAQARLAFERALSLDTNLVAARFGLAVSLFNMKELPAALEEAKKAEKGGDQRASRLIGDIQVAMQGEKPNTNAQR